MPFDRFALLLAAVVLAAGVTIWLGSALHPGVAALIPVALAASVLRRPRTQRLGSREVRRSDEAGR